MVVKSSPFIVFPDHDRFAIIDAVAFGKEVDGGQYTKEIDQRYQALEVLHHAISHDRFEQERTAHDAYLAECKENGTEPDKKTHPKPHLADSRAAMVQWMEAAVAEKRAKGSAHGEDALQYLAQPLIDAAKAAIPKDTPLRGAGLTLEIYGNLAKELMAVDPKTLAEDGKGTSAFAAIFLPEAAKAITQQFEKKLEAAAPKETPKAEKEKPAATGKTPADQSPKETEEPKVEASKDKKYERMTKAQYEATESERPESETFANVNAVYAFIQQSKLVDKDTRAIIISTLHQFVDQLPGREAQKIRHVSRDTLESEMAKMAANRFENEESHYGKQLDVSEFLSVVATEAKIDPRTVPTQKSHDNNMIAATAATIGLFAMGSALKASGAHTKKIEEERAARNGGKVSTSKMAMSNTVMTVGVIAVGTAIVFGVAGLMGNSLPHRVGANINHLARKLGDMIGLGPSVG